jgi:hypothetical protein
VRRFLLLLAGGITALPFLAVPARAQSNVQWGGFALFRAAAAPDDGPLAIDSLESQLHLGIDWTPLPSITTHVHLVGRTSDDDSKRGKAGVVEAYAEGNLHPNGDRLRVRAGALFLPTSRENVDALWETAYTLTPSALNTWFGEEFRPVGVDATYSHQALFAGATVFRGNDTFGALPPVRGWRLRDYWAVLGEHIRVDDEYFTSVSAETDGRIGWSARAGFNGEHLLVQATHIDNRSDALEYGELANWYTKFDIVAAEWSDDRWTVAAEGGWGPTVIIVHGNAYSSDLRASYLLASRRFDRFRFTVRGDEFSDGDKTAQAITGALLWTPRGPWRVGCEASASEGDHRMMLDVRYSFNGR